MVILLDVLRHTRDTITLPTCNFNFVQYLGNKTTERVKKRCIELIYSWQKGLPHEMKIQDAYKMLKTQGIVKEDPTYVDKVMFEKITFES